MLLNVHVFEANTTCYSSSCIFNYITNYIFNYITYNYYHIINLDLEENLRQYLDYCESHQQLQHDGHALGRLLLLIT